MESIVMNGVDLYAHLGLILGSKKLTPPAPRRYTVEVPGKSGVIDLTQALAGGTPYENRTHEFEFSCVKRQKDFEAVKTKVKSLFHGVPVAYTLPWDPGYTYTGFAEVAGYDSYPAYGAVSIKVDADPYKMRDPVTLRINAAGGAEVRLPSGRMPVRPTIEVARESVVDFGGRSYTLAPGTWQLRGIEFQQGTNVLVVNTAPDHGTAVWADYGCTWAELGDVRLSELANEGPVQEQAVWSGYGCTWAGFPHATWQEAAYPADPGTEEYQCYIHYEWGDL